MNKPNLLKSVAETGYNVGFGAKKHFATFDIVQKTPGWIAFLSFVIGVYALAYDPLSNKLIGATVVVMGIAGLYVSLYDSEKSLYEQHGINLTRIFTKLRDLYRDIQSSNEDDLSVFEERLSVLEADYYNTGTSKQILFSDWYAHYKFFWQHQIDWVDEQKKFRLFRDKLPLTFMLFCLVISIGSLVIVWKELQ
jgi:hypothetical protein